MAETIHPRRIGVCSWSLQSQTYDDLEGDLDAIRAGGVQLALGPLLEFPDAWLGAIERLKDLGHQIFSGMFEALGEDYSSLESIKVTGGVVPDATWPDTFCRAQAVAALAEKEGISLVTVHAGFIPHDESDPAREKVIGRLRQLGDLFAQGGTKLGLETGQESAATLLGAIEEISHPNIGVNFDPANMILYGMGDPIEALSTLAPYVVQVHAKDAIPTTEPGTWGTEVPLGEGAIDWDAFLRVVLSLDPPLNIMVERESGDSRVKDIDQALDRLVGE